MHLEKVEITGFRSFRWPQALEFEPGMTVVVGPGGCGKSALLEAIAWATGTGAADVIFNGAGSVGAAAMAEVVLRFSNGDVVSRSHFRRGGDEWTIHGKPCEPGRSWPVRVLASIEELRKAADQRGQILLLDTLDRGHDEHAVKRHAAELAELSHANQLIVTTDSKSVMVQAGRAYGVTMETFGISKVIGLTRG